MKHTLVRAAAVALLSFAAAVAASADIPRPDGDRRPPPPPPAQDSNVVDVVIESGDEKEAQIFLPPERMTSVEATTAPSGPSPASTVVAGTALSLALMSGGLWLVRSRRKLGARATATAASVLVVIAGTAVFGLANLAPPANYRAVDPGTLGKAAPGGALRGKARVYYGSDRGVVRIVLPKKK